MRNIITIAFLILSLFSCSESFLEKRPLGTLDENVLGTKEGVNGLLIGAYSLLNNNGALNVPNGNSFIGMHVIASFTSDDAFVGTIPNALLGSIEGHTYDATTYIFDYKWKMYYAGIQRCNDVLRILPQVTNISEQESLQIQAEARFLRGLYHLQAALMWRNIPFVDETITYDSGNYKVSNQQSAWPPIEADFQFASDNLSETNSDVGRPNSWAALCFLVKTYMFQHKYEAAKPLLDDIVSNGITTNGLTYDLNRRYFDNFSTETKHSSECVFAVQMSVNDGAAGINGNVADGAAGPFGSAASSGYGWVQPKFDFVNSFQTNSETGLPLFGTYNDNPVKTDQGIASTEPFEPHSGPLDSRLDWSVGRRGIPYLDWGINPGQAWIRSQRVGGPFTEIKHIAWQKRADSDIDGRFTNSPYNLIRFADVLLWAAEVEVEIGSLDRAEKLVNRIRVRSANPESWVKKYIDPGEPLKGFLDEPAANYKIGLYSGQFTNEGKEYAREAVRMERRLELGMEFHRYFDLQRYDNGAGYMAETINNALEYHKHIEGFDYSYVPPDGRFTKGKNEVFPIPQVQIDLSVSEGNATLIQNPGY